MKTANRPSVQADVRHWPGCLQIERGMFRLQLWFPTLSVSRGHIAVHADCTIHAVWSHNVGLAVQVVGFGVSVEYVPNAHALAEERSDDSQQRVVGTLDRKEGGK